MIDYLSKRKEGEQNVENLVKGRNVEDELSRMSKNVGDLRNKFLERSNALIESTGGTRGTVKTNVGVLDDKTQAALARKKLGLQRGQMEATYNNAYEMAIRYGADEAWATEYARQIAEQASEQAFEGSEQEKLRQSKRNIDQLAEQYGVGRASLMDEYQPKNNLGAKLLGMTLGVGTNYVMNKYLNKDKEDQNPYGSMSNKYGRSLRSSSGYSTGIDLYGRRK